MARPLPPARAALALATPIIARGGRWTAPRALRVAALGALLGVAAGCADPTRTVDPEVPCH